MQEKTDMKDVITMPLFSMRYAPSSRHPFTFVSDLLLISPLSCSTEIRFDDPH